MVSQFMDDSVPYKHRIAPHIEDILKEVVDLVAGVAEELNCIYGIGVRAGAFCVYRYVNRLVGITDDKDIVEALKHDFYIEDKITGLIRASIGLQNTMQDMILFVEAIKGIIALHQAVK